MSIAAANVPVYNASMPDGGNPLEVDVNAPYVDLQFHMVYQLIMGGLVFLIIPGIGLLYGGMARRKSSLAMIFQSFTIMALCTIQWMFWGYSLSFSRTGHSGFIGDMSNFVLWNVSATPFLEHVLTVTGHGRTIRRLIRPPRSCLLLLRNVLLLLRNHDSCRRLL
jgi:Ammonium Transporter Family